MKMGVLNVILHIYDNNLSTQFYHFPRVWEEQSLNNKKSRKN